MTTGIVMAQTPTQTDRFLADFDLFEAQVAKGSPPWLRDLRRDAISRFSQVGFPLQRRGNEEWKYTNVTPIAQAGFQYAFQPRPRLASSALKPFTLGHGWSRLVFVDGRFDQDRSSIGDLPKDALVGNLADAPSASSGILAKHLGQSAKLNGDGFTALSTAFIHDGAFISLPPGSVVEQPIHLLYVSTASEPSTVSYPRTLVLAGEGTVATVVESYVGLSPQAAFIDAITEIVLSEGAALDWYKLLLDGDGAYHVGTTAVRQKKDSVFHSTSIASGGRLVRDSLSVLLDGEGSECFLNGLSITDGGQHIDNHTFIDHAKPRTTSRELYKGILGGKSTGVFSGRVLVRKDAQKADARQTNRNLVLSPGARVDSKPYLEIFADDVKCAHGATAGKLDEESMFYLKTRGLDEQKARDLLAYAFAAEIIRGIPLKPLEAHVDRLLQRILPTLQTGEQR